MTTDILGIVDGGATVVTANRRLARRIRLDYAARQRARGREVWDTPKVLPWTSWLPQLWDEIGQHASEHRKLLTPQQDRALWASIVERSTRRDPLLRTGEAAASAQEAWLRMCAWRVPVRELHRGNTEETRAFRRWLNEYLARCTREGWIDPARLPDFCTELVPSIVARPRFARRLCLAGFSEVTPQQQSLLERLEKSGVETSLWAPQGAPRSLIAHAFPNTQEELTAAAVWARRQLESDSTRRVGVVVPDMTRHRQTVGRIFEDLLSPDAVLPGRSGQALSTYNLSLGVSLLEYPLVHTAMSILEFVGEALSYTVVGHLLRSPFLRGGEKEAEQRAILDAKARRMGPVNWRLPEFYRFATTQAAKAEGGCRTLWDVLERLEQVRRNAPRRALPSQWSILFRQMLLCAGWPGERRLDSAEYQTVEQINGLFGHLASLDAMLGAMDSATALKTLRRIAVDTVYQPQAQESRLVVMGALEASGSTFDALWVSGLNDRDWPPPPNPNPFLPVCVQRRCGLPHSSPGREREFAAVTLESLLAGASEAVLSWPGREEDETLRPSPLIKEVPAVEPPARDPEAFYHRRIFAARQSETLPADPGPELETTFFSGGSLVLKHQAACPFRAFALLRLGAESLTRPSIGIDAASRGRIVHRALEHLWNALDNHANLVRARSSERIEAMVTRSVEAAFRALPHRRDKAWLTLVQIEKSRLSSLVLELLDREAERSAFTVEASEFSQGVQIGPLKLNTRIDRIDRLDSGGRVIIDYKSGQAEVRRWFGARPDDPQLPLYAVANPEDLEGLVLASLRAGEVGFNGIVRVPNRFPGISPYRDTHYQREHGEWNRLLVEWESHLEALAVAFARGEARVDPKNSSTCDFCDLGSLCRIDEQRARVNG